MFKRQKKCLSKILGVSFDAAKAENAAKQPVLLNCGHSICVGCAVNGGPRNVTCGVCGGRTNLRSVSSLDFPRHSQVYSQAADEPESPPQEPITHTCMQAKNYCGYLEQIARLCDECTLRIADSICHTCNRNFCKACWPKVHPSENHVPLSLNTAQLKPFGRCSAHPEKHVNVFCKSCNSYFCNQCARTNHVGDTHKTVYVKDKNLDYLKKLKDLRKDVEENIARMEETISDVTGMKETLEENSISDYAKTSVSRFVYLHSNLQPTDESLRLQMKRREANKRIDLDNILTQLHRQIKVIRELLNDVNIISESDTLLDEISLENLLPRMISMKDAPCMLESSAQGSDGQPTYEESRMDSDNEIAQDINNFAAVNILANAKVQLVNMKGQNNSDLGYEPKSKEESRRKTFTVSKSVIVSGSKKKSKPSRSAPRAPVKYPFNRTQSSITQGCSYGIHLTYVKDPGEFYVIRSSMRKQQQYVEKIAPTLIDRCPRAPKKIHKDDVYLAECVLDKKWYRGRIVEVLSTGNPNEERSVLIYNLDYGSTQVVPQSRLRKMPDVLKVDPPMAIKCRLTECIPKNGKWCEESTKMMLEILDDGDLTMYVARVLPDILEVDLCHRNKDAALFDEELVSLRDSMVFMEYSVLATGSRSSDLKKSLTIQYPILTLPRVDAEFTGIITHVLSPNNIYMQKICIDTDYLMDLMDRINAFYDMYNQKGYIYNPLIGMPCVALCSQDYLWYRARIIHLPGHEKIRIQYIDYGNEETLHYKLVRKIKPEFLRLPPQAFLCSLKDIVEPDDPSWNVDAKTYLEKMSVEVFHAIATSVTDEVVEVELQLDACCSKNKPAGSLVEARRKDIRKFLRIRPSSISALVATTGMVPEMLNGAKIEEFFDLCCKIIRKKGYRQIKPHDKGSYTIGNPDSKLEENFKSEVKILRVTSPSDIYVLVQAFAQRIEEMDKELQRFCMTRAVKKSSPWIVGNNCAVLSYEHGKWLRGNVKEVFDNEMILVHYYDVVGTEEVPAVSLRILDSHFLTYPIGSIKCHLDGVTPPETKWPESINQLLIEEIEKHNKIYMTKRGKVGENPSLPVRLWVPLREVGMEHDHFSDDWLLLNEVVEESENKTPERRWNDLRSIVVDQEGRVRERESCSSAANNINAPSENDFKVESDDPETYDAAPIAEHPEIDWLQPVLSNAKYFLGEPTFVDNDGFIYMHDVDRDGSALEVLQYSLHQLFRDTQPNISDLPWAVNEICAAKYYIDNCWYRGRIVEIKEDMYKILFVDFGNVEWCHGAWLRRSNVYLDTPIMARKYKLFGINPVSEDGKWTQDAIDKIFEAVVEKKCNVAEVDVKAEAEDVTNICLRVCDNEQDLAEYLVGLGFATFDSEMELFSEEGSDRIGDVFEIKDNDNASRLRRTTSSYRTYEIPVVDFYFPIKVTVVREIFLSVNILDETSVYPGIRSMIASLERLTKQMQVLGEKQPLLNNITPGMACLCLYGNHGKWYRGEIERLDTRRELILVHYVDYGFKEYVTKNRIRTILPKWFDTPQLALNFKLHKLKKNPTVKKKIFLAELTQCLSEPNLVAKIIAKREQYYEVEILKRGSGKLAYQKLIDNGFLRRVSAEERVEFVDEFEEEDFDLAGYGMRHGRRVRGVRGEVEPEEEEHDETEDDCAGGYEDLEVYLADEILEEFEEGFDDDTY